MERRATREGSKHVILPGLTAPAGVHTAPLDNPDDVNQHVEQAYVEAENERFQGRHGTLLHDMLNISGVLSDAAAAMVDDSFLRCFTSAAPEPWNWNFYLFPIWTLGVVVRNCILFPLRLLSLLAGVLLFILLFFTIKVFLPASKRKLALEQQLVRALGMCFVMSWTGVVRFHGPRPMAGAGRIWVANHTSMIDYIILTSYRPFAVIMQLHPGWVGFLQTQVLDSLGCVYFNRTQAKDRSTVFRLMKEHVHATERTPLLVFPEGTCVNNEYCVMFKRGAFELDSMVHPIAIKYNKIFVDAFWNSKRMSFTQHLVKLMTSWAVVCDVYFLEPQKKKPEESVDEFAARVQDMIAKHAHLRVVPWDGYLKYYNLGDKHPQLIEKRRKVFADALMKYLPARSNGAQQRQKQLEADGGTEGLRHRGAGGAAAAVKARS